MPSLKALISATQRSIICCLSVAIAISLMAFVNAAEDSDKKMQILLVAGGCCHDYPEQTKLLKEGLEKRINSEVTVVLSSDTSTKATFKIYESDNWANGYGVVIHDECSANVTDNPYIDRILNAHRNGTPAVNLHCAMHSYRFGNFRVPSQWMQTMQRGTKCWAFNRQAMAPRRRLM